MLALRSKNRLFDYLKERQQPAPALFEPLEERRLFTNNCSFTDGLLTVHGSNYANNIAVYLDANAKLNVKIDGVLKAKVSAAACTRIVVNGYGGNDVLSVNANVKIKARVEGGLGNDKCIGGSGNDTVNGGDGNDSCYGSGGNDSCSGGNGNDSCYGGGGNDTCMGGSGDDVCNGDDGNDSCSGGDGNDTCSGGSGNDSLVGNAGLDVAIGGSGVDLFSCERIVDFSVGVDVKLGLAISL